MHTPWGESDHQAKIADGITSYSTPSHGGIKVSDELNKKIPDYMRSDDGWYEEDCDWAIVAIFFPQHFKKEYEQALDTFKNWYPEYYEKYFGLELKPGESFKKDEAQFHKDHVDDFLVVTAWGDWHKNVPKGYVGVAAQKCFTRAYFLVPADEYGKRGKFSFVIDEARHKQIPAIT